MTWLLLLSSDIRNAMKAGSNIQKVFANVIVFQDSTMLQKGASLIVTSMIIWFLLSIINSLAQNWHKRLCNAKKKTQ